MTASSGSMFHSLIVLGKNEYFRVSLEADILTPEGTCNKKHAYICKKTCIINKSNYRVQSVCFDIFKEIFI